MHRSLLSAVLSLSVLLSSLVAAQDAEYTFIPIEVPGAKYTFAFGINQQGDIVGTYIDSADIAHGFLSSQGLVTTLDMPEARSTDGLGVNNQHQVVGLYRDSTGGSHSFLYDTGVFTTFQLPGSVWTDAVAINEGSQIVGSYSDGQMSHGYLYHQGVVTTIDGPGAERTSAHGINLHGQIVGIYEGDNTRHGFLYDHGVFTTIDVPGASPFATTFLGINAPGHIVGYYSPDGFSIHGFLYEGGEFTTIDVPGASNTYIYGINDEGQLVGQWTDSMSVPHSFVATPVKPDTTPPLITVAASPATLSPPNGKQVTVTVSGTIKDELGGSGVQVGSTAYTVTDEYRQIQLSGPLTPDDADGSYTFTVDLQASRRGNDADGRHYTIMVSATDTAGNPGSASATVTVPHN